ncbi:MAG TPA: hypothetical protein VIJ96_16480 [Acidothermaceae bacterium]
MPPASVTRLDRLVHRGNVVRAQSFEWQLSKVRHQVSSDVTAVVTRGRDPQTSLCFQPRFQPLLNGFLVVDVEARHEPTTHSLKRLLRSRLSREAATLELLAVAVNARREFGDEVPSSVTTVAQLRTFAREFAPRQRIAASTTAISPTTHTAPPTLAAI